MDAQVARPNEPHVSSLANMLVRALAEAPYDSMYTWNQLRQIIFENPRSSRGNRAIQQAKRRLLREHQRCLVNVRDKGYQIVQPREQEPLSKRKDAAARRRVRAALELVTHVELAALTAQERQQVDETANRYRLKLALEKRLMHAKALPARADTRIPTGRELARLLTAAKP